MQITPALIKETIDDDATLWTLRRVEMDEIMALLAQHHPEIDNEDELFEALLDVMYKTRPTGPI